MKNLTYQSIFLLLRTRLESINNTTYQVVFLLLATTLFIIEMFIKTEVNSIQWGVLNSEVGQFIALGVYIAISGWGDKFIGEGETLFNVFPLTNILTAIVSIGLVKWQFDSYLYTSAQLVCITINISYIASTLFKKRTLVLN